MDKKEIQAGLLLLGTFVLGLATGVGGTMWMLPRAGWERPARHGPPPTREDEAEPTRFLPGIEPERRERIESAVQETRQSARTATRRIRADLMKETDAFLSTLRGIAPDADVDDLAEEAQEMIAGGRRGIPPPPHVREEFAGWLDEQRISEDQRRAAADAFDGYMERYWESFRSMLELSAQKRREVREKIGEELTDEERRELREKFREERPRARDREGRRPPPPPAPGAPPPPPPPHRGDY
ncbi:MAG: hypothetical protein KDH09_07770 [Chrysiogenetes bacterium]|nr:hypothetical protein [Chrysiogenetes bacterium]